MNRQNKLKVSVVVPCYNEEGTIGQCLEALANQTVQPAEIIIVDNNCSDNTVKVAKKYPGVRVVTEEEQGLVAARSRGLNCATGDILARLDADSRPASNWIQTMLNVFENDQIQAATGTGDYYDGPFKTITRLYRNMLFVWLNRLMIGHHMLWGSNMALRRSAWESIKSECCYVPNILEDLDIASHLNEHFGRGAVTYQPKLRADISIRRAMVNMKQNWLYLKMWPDTLKLHGYQKRALVWPAVAVLLTSIAFGNKILRFYNASQKRFIFSLEQWQNNPLYTRGNP